MEGLYLYFSSSVACMLFNRQVLELCVGFCEIADMRAVLCRLITESLASDYAASSLLSSIACWAVLSPTEITVAVECLQHIFEVRSLYLNYSVMAKPGGFQMGFLKT